MIQDDYPHDRTEYPNPDEDYISEVIPDEDRRVFSCPSCAGVNITLQGRCVVCTDCGWSSCVL